MDKSTTVVKPLAPFDFELTAGYHTYFQGRYGTDSIEGGVFRRLLDLDGKLVLASVRSVGSVEDPELTVELRGDRLTSEDAAAAAWRVGWLLGANQDLSGFYEHCGDQQGMADIIRRFHGLHLPHTPTVFEALVLAVLGQQISANVARVIRTLLIETYGPNRTFDGETYYSFPRPHTLAALSVEQLQALKLSRRKAEYVQGIAKTALEFSPVGLESLREMADDEVVAKIVELRGVGHWTAQWLLVRALGRPDALPLGDLALRRVVSRVFFKGEDLNDAQLEEFAARWSPWRAYATVYLFTALRDGIA